MKLYDDSDMPFYCKDLTLNDYAHFVLTNLLLIVWDIFKAFSSFALEENSKYVGVHGNTQLLDTHTHRHVHITHTHTPLNAQPNTPCDELR